MRSPFRSLTILAALTLAGCGSVSTTTVTTARTVRTTITRSAVTSTTSVTVTATPSDTTTTSHPTPPWTGFGARLPDWLSAHPLNLTHCPARACYGPTVVTGGYADPEYIVVETDGGRVDTYQQNFADGTTQEVAVLAVHRELPRDAELRTVRKARAEGGCVLIAFSSRMLRQWLGDGWILVTLETQRADGGTNFDSNDVTTVYVYPIPLTSTTKC